MRKVLLTAAAAALVGASSGASAGPVITSTFTANGVTDSFSQQGTAVFAFDMSNPNAFTVTLTDNVSPTTDILSELDGLTFGFSQAPSSITLTGISPASIVDCTNSTSPCPSGTGAFPYGWGTTFGGGTVTLGAGFDGTSTFSHEPFGIVNANYTAPGGSTGLSGAANNPLFVGPVTFTFATSGLESIPMITGVSFDFGIRPTTIDAAAVPEPRSLALLGAGFFAAWFVRRKRAR